MPAKTKLPALVGMSEIAELAGVPRNTVNVWLGRGKLPPPAARLALGPIWLKSDITAWLKASR